MAINRNTMLRCYSLMSWNLLFTALLCLPYAGLAQIPGSNTVTVWGQVPAEIDSVQFTIMQDYTAGPSQKLSAALSDNDQGKFSFTVAATANLAEIVLSFYRKGVYQHSLSNYLEAEQQMQIVVTSHEGVYQTTYRGADAASFGLKEKLKSQWTGFVRNLTDLGFDWQNPEKGMAVRFEIFDAGYQHLIQILEGNKSLISPALYNLFRSEYLYLYYGSWQLHARELYQKAKTPQQKEVIKRAYQALMLKAPVTYEFAQISLAESYAQLLVSSVQTQLLFENGGAEYRFSQLYNRIKARYSGIEQEHALYTFLSDFKSFLNVTEFDPKEFDLCLRDALSITKTPGLRKALRDKLVFESGATVYNFSLPDTSSRVVTLSDFRGRVVLLDVWGSGCSGCVLFANTLKNKVAPAIQEKGSLSIVSINIDSSRDRWIKSLNSGKYSQPTYTNLNTGGMDNPFLRYYRVDAIPFVLVVGKDGKLFSKIEVSTSEKEIVAIIQRAMHMQ